MEMGRQEGWGSAQRSIQKGFPPLPPQVSQPDVITASPCTVPAAKAWPDLEDPCVRGRKGNVSWHGVGVPHPGWGWRVPAVPGLTAWPPLKDAEAGDGPL